MIFYEYPPSYAIDCRIVKFHHSDLYLISANREFISGQAVWTGNILFRKAILKAIISTPGLDLHDLNEFHMSPENFLGILQGRSYWA
jgi:hypothetical protein